MCIVYNVLLLDRVRLDVQKISLNIRTAFEKNRSTTLQILTICHIIERAHAIYIYIYIYIYNIYIYIYIYHHHHHHHHVVQLARISLTLSRHFSLSLIASYRSSELHPVSSHSYCMYVLAGRPALARLYVGVHRSTSLMSSSLSSSSVLRAWFV